MPNVCCFCKKAQGSLDHAVSFHRFPKDPIQRNIWLQNCKLEDTARIEHKTLCSDHFNSSCYISNTNRLLKNAVPTIFPGGAEHLMPEVVETLDQPAENLISSPLTIFQPVRLFSESPSINTPLYSASCSTPISDDYSYSSDSSISTQTERCMTKNTPRKMKLKGKLSETESKLKKTVRERDNLKVINYNLQQRLNATPTLSDFEEMCDKFFNIKSMSDFVKNQARLCSTSSKGRRYTEKDKQFALMIHFYGPKVYRFLKKTWCLPSVRTLQRITEKWEIGVGISDFVLNVLSLKGQTMNVKGKECVLCADEMSLKSFLYYNYSKDEIIGLHEEETHKICDIAKTVLVLMIRGLHDSWKQPLGYFFVGTSCNSLSLKNIIFNCVSKLSSISFNVKVMISDMGANFKSFSDSVGVTPEHPYFNVGSQEVIYMFDPPHLLKSTRNNFFKYRFVSDDKIIESKHLKSFYEADNQRTHRLAPKLTDTHINPGPFQKMKVKYAAQIFSKTVTSGMSVCITDKSLPPESKDTILFIDSMDNLFDIFNSRPTSNSNESDIELEDEPTGLKRFCFPYDGSSYQNNFLLSMFNFFKNLKIQKYNVVRHQWVDVVKSYNIKFLKGWMVSIAGLIRLYTNLSLNYDDLKLFSRRLNQDCLENLFGTIRIQNGNCINPTTIQFQRSFKKLFCLSYFEYNDGANCIEDLDSVLTNMNNTPAEQLKVIFPEKKCVVQINKLSVDGRHYRSLALPEKNAFIYICGYLISKCLKIHSCDSCLEYARSTTELSSEHFFTYFKSHQQDSTSIFSSLMTPDSNFCQYVYELDQIFTNNFQQLLPLPKIVVIHIAFKLASFDENNEFESKKRKKHKKDKYEDKEKSGGLKLILKVGSGSCLPADEIVSNTNGNHETNDYLSKSHKKKKKKHKHHKEKKKRMRDDITIHEEISLGEETLAEAPLSKRPTNFENNSRVTTNSTEPQNGEWKSEETNNTNENRQTLQQLLTHLLRALERRDPQQLFAWPVTDRIAPNYSRLISKPMDFETIRRSIQSDLYTSLNAFVADFKLMCENAMTYNQPETIYYKAAKRLLHAGLKLTGPEKLKTLLSALPGMANIPPSQLGFDITQEYHGDTSNDTIIENIERSSERLHDNDLLNQRKIISKFEAIPDNLTPDEILKQAQNAAKAASEKLATKNTKMGFLKQQNNGSTSLSILVPNDGINPETGERPVLLGSLIGKLSHGVGSIPGFREDRRNMVKTVKPLYYGAFGSYAPTYDSTFANLTKDESDLVLRTYGDEASAQYAESILNFTKDSDYAMTMADNLLDLMTGGDHRKTKRVLDERKKQQVVLDDTKKSVSQLHQPSSCQPLATTLINTGGSNTTTANHQTKSAPIQIDQLKSLSELGIDTKFIDYYQEQSVFQDRLDHVGGLLGRLQNVQNQRLSAPLPQHLSQIAHPSPQEIQLADKITESLAENLKRVPPSAVMSVTGVRKAMGIAQISHLELNQNNCHPSNLVNHGSSHQQTQVSLIGDGIQDRVEGVEGTVSGVDLESELREFLESDPTLTSFPLHDENDRTIEEILSES